MNAYVSFHPTHPDTYAVIGARCFALFLIPSLLMACGTSRKSVQVEEKEEEVAMVERRSVEQILFSFFDSISTSKVVEADSLEWVFYDAADIRISGDSLNKTSARQKQAAVRPTSRLNIKGIRSNTRTDQTRTSTAKEVSQDTSSLQRFRHDQVARSNIEEKVVKPPNTIRHLAFLTMAIAILLSLILFAVKRKQR